MDTTSASLLERIAYAGESSDWAKLHGVYRPFIQSIVSSYPSLVSDADDIAQEVMLVLMRELPVFQRQRKGSFRLFLRQITINQLRNLSRKSQKNEAVESIDLAEQLADPKSVAAQSWDKEYERNVLKKIIELVRPTVSEKDWTAFDLYALQNQPAESVAESLQLSVNSVHQAKSRILRRLRTETRGLLEE